MAASGERLPAAPSDSLMRLGSVRDVVLARVPLEAHRALGQTCKPLRRLVYSDDFAKLRRTLGCEEYGLLLLGGHNYDPGADQNSFVCLTHNLESLGFAALDDEPLDLDEFKTALSTDGRLIVCGDANYSRKVLVYDTREHVWVRDSRYPASLPVKMYSQCTAFLDNTLVSLAGGTQGLDQPWGYAWNEQLQMWEQLPPLPTAVSYPGHGVIGSRLFVVGGHSHDTTHAEHYGGGDLCDYSARLQIFDMTTRTWSLGPPLDALRDRLEQPRSAAVYNGRLYVFCHRVVFSGTAAEIRAHLFHAYCFDPRSNSWSELPALPVGSDSNLAACVHGGRLVVVGTINDDPENPAFYREGPSTYMYDWDDRARTWTRTWRPRSLLFDDVHAWPAGRLESLVSVPLRIR